MGSYMLASTRLHEICMINGGALHFWKRKCYVEGWKNGCKAKNSELHEFEVDT